jgi:hypothetical protein
MEESEKYELSWKSSKIQYSQITSSLTAEKIRDLNCLGIPWALVV